MLRKPVLRILALTMLATPVVSCTSREKVVEETYPNGNPKHECTYTGRGSNREMVKETFYYPDKLVQMTGAYNHGKRDGFWVSYYANGKKWSEGYYRNGKNDGKRITYFESGKIRYIGYYDNDRRVGKWQFFDEAGNLLKEVNYTPGSPQTKDSTDSSSH
jgi:antitoxin component YwqK of YwqJK toxin-antitoxin module